MRIGLIDVDGHNFPNLALMKLSAWHKQQGDEVEWCLPIMPYDRVYQSRVFDDTYSKDIDYVPNAKEIVKGGTGYGLPDVLPDEIEHIYPDYSLYPKLTKDTAYGFLTRGCPRHCGFCIVGDKEGLRSHRVADLSEFWKDQKRIKLLDPNLLACNEHLDLMQQLADSKAYIDFTQGLDIRLTNPTNIDMLNTMRIKTIHFAWDNPEEDLGPYFERFTELYRRKSPQGKIVYCLTNYNSTLEQDLYRIETLKKLKYNPYIMVYDKPHAPQIIRDLQRWCNNRKIYYSCSFNEYIKSLGRAI